MTQRVSSYSKTTIQAQRKPKPQTPGGGCRKGSIPRVRHNAACITCALSDIQPVYTQLVPLSRRYLPQSGVIPQGCLGYAYHSPSLLALLSTSSIEL